MHLPDAVPFQNKAFKHLAFKHLDFKRVCLAVLLPAALLSTSTAVKAQPSSARHTASSLTVEITGIKNASGEVCINLFSGNEGFPDNEESIVEKQCIAAVETNPDTTSPAEVQPESPAELPAEVQSDEGAAVTPTSELAEIPGPVMENIIEGLANNASNPDTGLDTGLDTGNRRANAEEPATNAASNPLDDVVITQAVLAITFTAIAPGTYAVSVLHDENEDGQLNTGTFGIPTEGFGFSQNPDIRTGAPDFSEAAIVVVGTKATTQVELIYY